MVQRKKIRERLGGRSAFASSFANAMEDRQATADKSGFVVVAELTGGPNFDFTPISKFLSAFNEASPSVIPAGFDFAGITLPQNPGGTPNIEPVYAIEKLLAEELSGDLDFIPHISCKDHNANAIVNTLVGLRALNIETILALTGDKPVAAKGVFELDSIGLLQLVRDMNNESYIKSRPQDLDRVHQFFPGAAVSPFKYTEASQMQQYYKMGKKIACGAKFLITQVGWDWKKSQELFRYLNKNGLNIPVIGNVYVLSTTTPAPRLMHDIKLTGCFVSDQFLAKLYSESAAQHIERAAQQVAMYKAIGAAGVDIGGIRDFDTFVGILQRADEIGSNWEQFKDNLYWPAKDAFYLYNDAGRPFDTAQGRPAALSKPRKTFKHKFFDFFHRAVLNPDYRGFRAFKRVMAALGAEKGKGAVYKLFNAAEGGFKYLVFDCEACGDCYLPENFGLCTIGGCEKGMANAPCGDATADGKCGNDLERVCIGELIYQAAASEEHGLEKLQKIINKPRIHALEHSSSILNYLFGRDHTMKNPIIFAGESIHASIPKTGQIMKQLAQLGPDAYTKPSGPLNYIKALIESQANDGADYIAVNVDVFGEDAAQSAVAMMREYVKLVRKWGKGVPICVDSGSNDVLAAGLKEWFNTDQNVKQPLINSIKVYTMDKFLPLKKEYDYAFIGLLITEEKPTGPGGSYSVDELHSLAKRIFDKAVGQYGFKRGEIFFDSTVFPIAIDMPMEPGVPGYTYRAFETIKRIKADATLKGVHCSLGISNSVRDLPGRRIGVCRAYLAKAMEFGLDAGIVNVAHHYGQVPPDPDLVELVDAYAKMDGSAEATNRAMTLMGKFCQENRKTSA
ncbi:MAG: methylenetetrahydrofolate reductase C-terminal domain-containing protein [Sedimentisphaerales bacterium]|nr:methylenetetrahydrofolate reductase C-terminal domain-containing protein [Sedimentisphaerales bacterium]